MDQAKYTEYLIAALSVNEGAAAFRRAMKLLIDELEIKTQETFSDFGTASERTRTENKHSKVN